MTLELDSKPTRTRRPKGYEITGQSGVTEESADLAPVQGPSLSDVYDEPEETTPQWLADSRASRAAAKALADDIDDILTAPALEESDTAEIPMTPEQQAEFERRARMGLGGPQEPTILVTTYDANGESIDAEVVRSERAQEAAATGEPDPERIPQSKQIEMPGFEGHKATKVTVSFSGSITLDLGIDRHKAMWDELRWQTHKALTVTAFVNGKGFKAGKDNVAGASLTVMSAHMEEDAYGLPDGDDPCEACGREHDVVTADDVPLCQECFDSLEAEQADDPGSDSSPSDEDENPVATALDEALAIAGEDDGDA